MIAFVCWTWRASKRVSLAPDALVMDNSEALLAWLSLASGSTSAIFTPSCMYVLRSECTGDGQFNVTRGITVYDDE